MFNKTSLFQGSKDCSQRGTAQSMGDALAYPLTLQLCSSVPVLKTTHSCEKLIKSKVLKL